MGKPLQCAKCSKSVGWAESVVRDDSVYHRDCFRCAGCNKKLDRGSGLKDHGDYFCRSCHNKQYGPMGFNKGVVKSQAVMKRVTMNVQPPFAYVATSKENRTLGEQKEDDKKLHEFDVAMFAGESVAELKKYLEEGGCNTSAWTEQTFRDLLEHIKLGKCELGLDVEGKALRVATYAKVFIYDEAKNLVLFNPLNSHELTDFVSDVRARMKKESEPLQKVLGDLEAKASKNGFEVKNDNMYGAVAATLNLGGKVDAGNVKVTPVEIPGALIFETTFSPFKETPRDAAARVLSWRFNLSNVTGRIFSKVVPKRVKNQESTHYPGLRSEYYVHQVLLNSEFIVPLQKVVPVDQVTPVGLDEVTNSGINTHWYVWLGKSQDGKATITQLKGLYEQNAKVKNLVGKVEFDGPAAQRLGELLAEEAGFLDLWTK